MAAVAGICHIDGTPVDSRGYERLRHHVTCGSEIPQVLGGPGDSCTAVLRPTEHGPTCSILVHTSAPSSRPPRPLWAVCDGHIYNRQDLKPIVCYEELDSLTCTDADIVLAAYLRWGVD